MNMKARVEPLSESRPSLYHLWAGRVRRVRRGQDVHIFGRAILLPEFGRSRHSIGDRLLVLWWRAVPIVHRPRQRDANSNVARRLDDRAIVRIGVVVDV